MLRNVKKLKGYKLGALDGDIGKVKDFYFDDQRFAVRYLVADTGPWLPGKQVLISPYALQKVREVEEVLEVALSKKRIEGSPTVNLDKPVSRQFEIEYYKYFGWPLYWYGPNLWGSSAYPGDFAPGASLVPPEVPPNKDMIDPHLRSTTAIMGHRIQARDDEIGHVQDFIVDDENWALRYLVVDTRNWWPGKKVLISPLWIERVNWEESRVFVDLPREVIKNAPEYLEPALITRDYENQLFDYYKREGYWNHEQRQERLAQSSELR
jgi:hypothetical protein